MWGNSVSVHSLLHNVHIYGVTLQMLAHAKINFLPHIQYYYNLPYMYRKVTRAKSTSGAVVKHQRMFVVL